MPKADDLSAQAFFVEEYLVDLNATAAAFRAGFSPLSASAIDAENLQKPVVAAAIEKRFADRVKRLEVTQDAVVQHLAAIAFSDISDVAKWKVDSVLALDSGTRSETALAAVAQVSETAHGVTLRMHDKRASPG